MIDIQIDPQVRGLGIGIIEAHAVAIGPPGPELRERCADAVRQVKEEGTAGGDARREAIRQMLRAGGFRPAGRNKPAQEYLLRTATENGELPAILNAVDWLNAVSLESGLPISLLTAHPFRSGMLVRYGRPGESFVFNRTGQQLDLQGLVTVCSMPDDRPLGTPIKDSMAGKVAESDQEIVAVIYSASRAIDDAELAQWCEMLARGYRDYCSAQEYEIRRVSGTPEGHH